MTDINKFNRIAGSDDRRLAYTKIDLVKLTELLIPWQQTKDVEYQSHWAKRGLLGYYYGCITRQTDRAEPGFKALLSDIAPGFEELLSDIFTNNHLESDVAAIVEETDTTTRLALSLLDTLVDTAVYALMGICLITAKFPRAGDKFIKTLEDRISAWKKEE